MLTVDRQMGLNIVHPHGKVMFQDILRAHQFTALLACKNFFYSIILRLNDGH